jgi:hypothetical protein
MNIQVPADYMPTENENRININFKKLTFKQIYESENGHDEKRKAHSSVNLGGASNERYRL